MKKLIKIFIRRNKKIVVVSLSIILVLTMIFIFNKKEKVYASDDIIKQEEIELKEEIIEKVEEISEIETIKVDIKGEVINPGVYELELGKRIIDVVNLSGGLTKNAKTLNVNLSKKIYDEMVIIIPDSETTCDVVSNYIVDENKEENSIKTGLVNINSASLDELLTLTGIGESKAKAIIEYRKENRFETIEDIMNIAGIKESMFNKIKDEITV